MPYVVYNSYVPEFVCAHGGDTSISFKAGACDNASDAVTTAYTYAQGWQVPANYLTAGKVLRITYDMVLYSGASAPQITFNNSWGGTPNSQSGSGTQIFSNGISGVTSSVAGFAFSWVCTLTAYAGPSASSPISYVCSVPAINGAATVFGANQTSAGYISVATNTANYLPLGLRYTQLTGMGSGTYTSGITATGTTGQTCTLTAFNGSGGSAATATVALTGTNTIASSTPLVITNTGYGYTGTSTSATAGNGTATCSGTATITTVLGGSQGNALGIYHMMVEAMN